MGDQVHLEDVISTEQDVHATPSRGLFRWDPRLKLVLLIGAVVLNVWVALPGLSAIVLACGLGLLLWSRPRSRQLGIYLLAPLWPTAIVVGGFAIGFGQTLLATIGSVQLYREGLLLGMAAALRVYCDITWLALIFLTTPFGRVLGALRWFRVPPILVDTLAMMYRYSFLLYAEFHRMRIASQSRGGRAGRWREIKSLARIAAQLFMRAFDRSERIYWAMFARGGERI
jgi:cobalt/nickel transport system permease protein